MVSRLVSVLEPQKCAALMMVATKPRVREWDWYSRDYEEFLTIFNGCCGGTERGSIRVQHQIDPCWTSHANLLEMVRSSDS